MKKRKTIILALIFLLLSAPGHAQQARPGLRKLIIFYSPACHRCSQIKSQILPEIENKFKDKILLEYRDINDLTNYMLLLRLEKTHNTQIKHSLPVFYIEGNFLNGEGNVKEALTQVISRLVALPSQEIQGSLPAVNLIERFRTFEPLAVASAGLIDGINPCAFTVIVFFISFLVLQGYKKRELVSIGISFIFSVFLTYLLIGIGFFGFLYRLRNLWLVAKIFNIGIGIFSVILGLCAIYDFLKFKKSGKTEGLVLQLPQTIKNQIHSVIGLHYRKDKNEKVQGSLSRPVFRLVLTAFISGFLVAILELVCTGQVYVPTITFVLKTTPLKLQALSLLLLYNLMFILPLFVIFILALLGTTSEEFSRFLKKHILTVKILTAVLFFSLGLFLIWKG
jgi:cytochrome c biogenesis protein CcdA